MSADDVAGVGTGPGVGEATVAGEREVRRPQDFIVTVFGLHGRDPAGGPVPLPVSGLITLLADLGFDSAAVRSSISRLKKRAVLHSRPGRPAAYTLAPGLHDVFAEGDRRIFGGRRAGADDPWVLASFTVPESERHVRHSIRRILTRRGFGSVTPGLWIAPAATFAETRSRLERDGLAGYVDFFESHVLGAEAAGLAEKVARWWDLPALATQYRDFSARWEPVRRSWLESDPGDGRTFVDHVTLITQWRRFPYLDPGLPLALLPDPWPGQAAAELFGELRELVRDPADRHVAAVLGR